MAFRPQSWLNRKSRDRAQQLWGRLADHGDTFGNARTAELRDEAFALRQELDRFLDQTNRRLALSQARLAQVPLPSGTDWRWRPDFLSRRIVPSGVAAPVSGAQIGGPNAVWHDCAERALTLRQVQNSSATDLAAFGMRLEVMGFSGSFLSLAIDLPDEALSGLSRNHIVRVETSVQIEREMNIYLRLNIGNGPNTEEILRHLGGVEPGGVCSNITEFDLAITEMNERRLDKIWLDVIFEKPGLNAVILSEMIVSRHPRANI